ncbi:MAG: thioredoxin family protein [Candidatus Electrothrix sp. YB6]
MQTKNRLYLPVVLVAAGMMFFSCFTPAEAVTTTKWYTTASDYKKVSVAAEKEKKPFILFFYTDWCGFCKKLNSKYLSNSQVESVLNRCYRVKINPEKGKKELALAHKKHVRGYPDFRVVLPDGRNVKLHPFTKHGSWTVKEFTAALKDVLAQGS